MKSIPIESLTEVLGYLHDGELNHYRDCRLSGDDASHIYGDVLTLLRWIERTYAEGDARTFARQCLDEYEAAMEDDNVRSSAA